MQGCVRVELKISRSGDDDVISRRTDIPKSRVQHLSVAVALWVHELGADPQDTWHPPCLSQVLGQVFVVEAETADVAAGDMPRWGYVR
jgi:hypothetical protein